MRVDLYILRTISVLLIVLMLWILATSIAAHAQPVPRPNTTLQTGIGTPELLTNSIPGQGVTRASPAQVQTLTQAAVAQPIQPATAQTAQGVTDMGFDASAYYRARADFARERMAWEEQEAMRFARMSARLGGGVGSASMSAIISTAMAGCSAKESSGGGFWAGIGNRMGRSKECREQQTTARYMMCNMVAVELQSPSIVGHCTQLAQDDSKWVGFWTQAMKAGVTVAGIHYGAGVLSDVVGLGRFAVEAGVGTANQALQTPAPDPFLVEPTIIETPAPLVVNPVIVQNGGGGG